MSVVQELRRRNVFRVGAAYVVTAWLLLQLVDIVVPILEVPDWLSKSILLLLVVGFPIALLFAWAFELTPDGLKFERDVDRSESITAYTGRKLDFIIIGILSIALLFFALDKFLWRDTVNLTTAPEKRSIAVLPFANMSGDPEQLYFSDGISEEILNSLVRAKGISVASRTSSFTYRGDIQSIPEIAEELGVIFVLEGSVRKSGNQLRITAQLIDARTDRHLWSESYDRKLEDIFVVQSDIANSITRSIQEEMGIETGAPIPARTVTRNMDAYDLYLKGYAAFSQRAVLKDVLDGVAYLEQAVALDPQFAVAWEYLAAAYSTAPFWGPQSHDLIEYLDLSDSAADRALSLDADLAFAYAVKAGNTIYRPPYDLADALRQYEIAIEKDPANPTSHNWLGILLLAGGYFEEGIAAQKRCLDIDPLYWNCLGQLRDAYHAQGRPDLARDITDALIDGYSGNPGPIDVSALLLEDRRVAAYLASALVTGLDGAPTSLWVKALENPNADHSKAYQLFDEWAVTAGVDMRAYPAILAAFGVYDQIDLSSIANSWFWLPGFEHYRASDAFKAAMKKFGYHSFWKTKGYPSICRPTGGDDIECD
jgi:TolB-like protein